MALFIRQNFGNMTSQAQRIAHELRQQHTETCAAMNAASVSPSRSADSAFSSASSSLRRSQGRAEELNLRLQSLAKQLSQDRLEFEEDLASLREFARAGARSSSAETWAPQVTARMPSFQTSRNPSSSPAPS